jgi:transcription antitermination factor NusG
MNTCRGDVHALSAWHVLYTRHQHEKVVAHALSDKGFEVFLPLYSVTRRWKDRYKQLSLPLFPCYVFLQERLERRLDIVTTPGVHMLVTSAGLPAVVPDEEIQAVRLLVEKGQGVEPHPFLNAGSRVRVKHGPIRGVEGILVRQKNLFRLVVSIEILGRSAAVEVDASMVECVGPGQVLPWMSAAFPIQARVPVSVEQYRPGEHSKECRQVCRF